MANDAEPTAAPSVSAPTANGQSSTAGAIPSASPSTAAGTTTTATPTTPTATTGAPPPTQHTSHLRNFNNGRGGFRGRGRGRARGRGRGRGRASGYYSYSNAHGNGGSSNFASAVTSGTGAPESGANATDANLSSAAGGGVRPLPTGIVAFVGAGNMARALISGLLGRGMEPGKIRASARTRKTLSRLGSHLPPSSLYTSNTHVVSGAELVVLCVKPAAIDSVAREVAASLRPGAVVVSVAVGVSVARLERALGTSAHIVVRAMPNVAAAVGKGVTAVCTREGDVPVEAMALFAASGVVRVVEERLLGAVSVVSGAGLAYCMMMAEALSDAGVRHGLPREVARELAAATMEGAGALATGQPTAHFAMLRNGIESPGGVTAAATAALERGGLRGAVHDAVDKAMERIADIERQREPSASRHGE